MNGQQEKGSKPAFYLKASFHVNLGWSLSLWLTHVRWHLTLCLTWSCLDLLLCSQGYPFTPYSWHLPSSPAADTTLLHQIIFSIFSKLLLSNSFPSQILLCPAQVSCGFWIMLSAGEIMATEMSKEVLVHEKFTISLRKRNQHDGRIP